MDTLEKICAGFSLHSDRNFSLTSPASSLVKVIGCSSKMKHPINQNGKIPIITTELKGESKPNRNCDRFIFVILLLVVIGISAGIIVHLILNPPGDNPHLTPDDVMTTTPRNSLTALQKGTTEILGARKDWQWTPHGNADAILGLTLSDGQWFQIDQADVYVSVLAMNLELLAAINKDSNLTDEHWSTGKLAKYTSALQTTCQDPRDFYGNDLLLILKQQLVLSAEYFRQNRFALSWVAIALCNSKDTIDNTSYSVLTAHPGEYKFGVGEASMILMALTCMNDTTAKNAAETYIVEELRVNYTSYNAYSKSLAVQALTASKKQGVDDIIKKALTDLKQEVLDNSSMLQFPAAASHILPALVEKSYLNVVDVDCSEDPMTTTTTGPLEMINIEITVENGTANATWGNVTAVNGSSLFQFMQNLQRTANDFSFVSETTAFGPSVKTINGVTAETSEFMYWQILGPDDKPSQTGVSSTKPKDGDHFTFRLTSWKT